MRRAQGPPLLHAPDAFSARSTLPIASTVVASSTAPPSGPSEPKSKAVDALEDERADVRGRGRGKAVEQRADHLLAAADQVDQRDGEGESRNQREQRQIGERVRAQQQLVAREALRPPESRTARKNGAARARRARAAPGSTGAPLRERAGALVAEASAQSRFSSTRRFSARPSAVSFDAIGFDSP